MHQKLSWLWPVSVIVFACLPLFVGLGRSDLQGDEAIYAFGVDRILDSGDWLAPKSSPDPKVAFLEKPPLKFWIVAAPIYFGLLPHNEFGLRFWDAVFGSLAFLYVFWLCRRLSSGLGGAVAALILIVHAPLVLQHGLRSNNMEAPLVLGYCGGLAHFMAWSSASTPGRRRTHALLAALYFVLGFMTKFVAAVFLPLVAGLAVLLSRGYRQAMRRAWRDWIAAAALAAALIAPWFVYAQARFGAELWKTMLGAHVYVRFTSYLDPTHLHPWYFYFVTMYRSFVESGAGPLVGPGLVVLAAQTIRRRSADGLLVLLWAVVPLCLISIGTSKLYHYAYPFVPPFAVAGGVFAACVAGLAQAGVRRVVPALDRWRAALLGPCRSVFDRQSVGHALLGLTLVALAVAVATMEVGQLRINVGGVVVKNSGVLRPLVLASVLALLGRTYRWSGPVVAFAVVWVLLPRSVYVDEVSGFGHEPHPMRSARDCLLQLQRRSPSPGPPGVYMDLPPFAMGHPLNYYFFGVRPWVRAEWAPAAGLAAYMYDPTEVRPALAQQKTYDAFVERRDAAGGPHAAQVWPAAIPMMDDIVLLLPRPYAACAPDRAGPQ